MTWTSHDRGRRHRDFKFLQQWQRRIYVLVIHQLQIYIRYLCNDPAKRLHKPKLFRTNLKAWKKLRFLTGITFLIRVQWKSDISSLSPTRKQTHPNLYLAYLKSPLLLPLKFGFGISRFETAFDSFIGGVHHDFRHKAPPVVKVRLLDLSPFC